MLVPQRCAACGTGERIVCSACLAAIPLLRGPLCARCGAPTAWPVERCAECSGRRLAYVRARAAAAYEDPVRTPVAAWKERGQRGLGQLICRARPQVVPRPPVGPPLPPSSRGSGAQPLARAAPGDSRLLGAEWRPAAGRGATLERHRRRSHSSARAVHAEWRQDVREATSAAAPAVGALVDDVYTTGVTARLPPRASSAGLERQRPRRSARAGRATAMSYRDRCGTIQGSRRGGPSP